MEKWKRNAGRIPSNNSIITCHGLTMADLFHAITQSIDSVLTCHYFDSFRENSMSDKLMNTEAGGEQTQYERSKTFTEPTEKQSGRLGDPSTSTSNHTNIISAERGQQTADNVRYGQNISESGMGGKTTTSTGTANQGGYGGVKAQEGEDKLASTRREQNYGPGNDVGS